VYIVDLKHIYLFNSVKKENILSLYLKSGSPRGCACKFSGTHKNSGWIKKGKEPLISQGKED